jgi:serine/threonine protein kinase
MGRFFQIVGATIRFNLDIAAQFGNLRRCMSLTRKRFARELVGRRIGGWTIKKAINAGKSAVVFLGQKKRRIAAVKVFDPDLIDKFGKPIQAERVERERQLIGKTHPNLIRILDGGHDRSKDLFFVVMELFDGPNLTDCLKQIPDEAVPTIIAQVASAAQFLEHLGIAHRDIKPSNIGIADGGKRAVLMDLGVIKPVGLANLTDAEGKRFVGTLQYASPEFLFRTEADTPDGWRATTFYQLGGVLHDLLMKRPLFAEYVEPFARLVEAVKERVPVIETPNAPKHLIDLAEHCLVKSPEVRLKVVQWRSFAPGRRARHSSAALHDKIRKRVILSNLDSNGTTTQTVASKTGLIQQVSELSQDICIESGVFAPCELVDSHLPANAFSLRFAPSERFGIAANLLITFRVSMHDSIILGIEASSIASQAALPLKAVEADGYSSIYFGKFSQTKVRDAIKQYIYLAYSQAQECNFKTGESKVVGQKER